MRRTPCPGCDAGRVIHDLMQRLIDARRASRPDADEAEERRAVWRALREHAGLDDPNRLDRRGAEGAVWALLAMLELEAGRPPEQAVRNLPPPACV